MFFLYLEVLYSFILQVKIHKLANEFPFFCKYVEKKMETTKHCVWKTKAAIWHQDLIVEN